MSMVHKSNIIPGLSSFIDSSILSQYAPTSMKRIIGAGAAALFLRNNERKIDTIISTLGIVNSDNMVNIELARDILKSEISKAGFMRIGFPVIGDVDFTSDDVDELYKNIISINQPPQPTPASIIT
jgi:hypothetical protein